MAEIVKIDADYRAWMEQIVERYRSSQTKAAVKVNREMLRFYWSLGEDIVRMKLESIYGDGILDRISSDLKQQFPSVKGFSVTNLNYMKRFYLMYNRAVENHPQLVGNSSEPNRPQPVGISLEQIFSVPWGHHRYIIDHFYNASPDIPLFYVRQTIEHGLSRDTLLNLIDANLHLREGKAITNFEKQLPSVQSDLAKQITRDPYQFDFLTLQEPFEEKELKDQLVQNVEKFLLEMGTGFAYMGREYRLVVGKTEQFLDMLFYNTKMHSYVVVEVKARKFEPGDLGQLGTYVVAVDEILRSEQDNQTIGLLICKTKDEVLAQYALKASNQPIGVSEYTINQILPEPLKDALPSIKDLQEHLEK